MMEVIKDDKVPIQKRVSDVAIEDSRYTYAMAVSRYGTPYVMTRVMYGSDKKYVFVKVDGHDKTKSKRNPHELFAEVLSNGYKVYLTYDQMEFYESLSEAIQRRMERKRQEDGKDTD